jgi:hypothetical protein
MIGTSREQKMFAFTSTWDQILAELGPMMLDEATESDLEERLESHLVWSTPRTPETADEIRALGGNHREMWDDDFEMVCVQLRALGLVETGKKKRPITDTDKYLMLTDKGRRHLVTLRAVQKGVDPGHEYLQSGDDDEDNAGDATQDDGENTKST